MWNLDFPKLIWAQTSLRKQPQARNQRLLYPGHHSHSLFWSWVLPWGHMGVWAVAMALSSTSPCPVGLYGPMSGDSGIVPPGDISTRMTNHPVLPKTFWILALKSCVLETP